MNITEKLLTVNRYSRPGTKRKETTKIAVHYVANPKSTAIANRNYFENNRLTKNSVSSNYIVGLEGEVIRCVPDDEIAHCTNTANAYSISIECCHPDWTGKFNDKTYASLVELCAELLKKYGLTANDLIRHYDVTGKICPKCFVPASKGGSDDDKQTAWKKFKADVEERMADAIRKPAAPVQGSFSPFLVKVTCTALNVRADAGTSHKIKTVVHKNEVYTIVDTKQVGNSTWGKLKSGAGWINIGSAYCKKL